MFYLLLALSLGVLAGYLVRKRASVRRYIQLGISLGLFFLIFMMGIQVGGNPEVMAAIGSIGWQAACFSVFTAAGSVLFALPLSLWLKHRQTREKTMVEP
ncbi:MAG: lysine exporter LysO family protein [Negativicutes bacterium]|nr:lysine exporter LysO family protein [Negativicutes bacterium]